MADKPLASEISEDQLIGMCLTDPETTIFESCEAGITPEWFFQVESCNAYRVILDLYVNQKIVSMPTAIERAGEMKVKLTLEYATRCIDTCPVYDIKPVIEKMREMYLRRAMVEQAKWMKNHSSVMDAQPEESIGKTICTLADLTATHQRMSLDQIKKAIVGRYRAACGGGTAGVPTPWDKVNKTLGGLMPSQVTVFAGRGGIGKSQASATLVHHLGSTGIPVGYLPFEDGLERTWARLGGIEGKYSTFRMDTGASEAECSVAEQYIEQVMKYPIHMEDRPMTADQVMAWAIHQKVKNKIQLLVIDAFKDLRRKTRDVAEDDSMSQTITQIARRLNIPVWISHHVRKLDTSTKSQDKLTADDIRGSANIVNDARSLIVCQNWKDEHDNMCFSFDVVKNNNGPCPVSIPMERVSKHNYWREVAETTEN